MYTYISKSELDTINLGYKFASKLNSQDILILSGNLGSGKTKFTEGFLKYFNLEKEISSPTFTIVNEHISDKLKIYHFDVYRLENIDEFYEIGGDEYLNSGICIIEWGEKIESVLPKNYIKFEFEKDTLDENTRIVKITAINENLDIIIKEVINMLD